jgi:hypothetical protein
MRLLLPVLVMLAASFPSRAVEIENFKSGLACVNTKITEDGTAWVCQETEDVLITDQGNCVFDSKEKPCTWYGFEFDYKDAGKETSLACEGKYSESMTSGNPKGITSKDTTSDKFELKLEGEQGHFSNPMYSIFRAVSPGNEIVTETITCSFGGKVLFIANYKLRFPTLPKEST